MTSYSFDLKKFQLALTSLIPVVEDVFLSASTAAFERLDQTHQFNHLLQLINDVVSVEGRRQIEEEIKEAALHLERVMDQFDFLDHVAVELEKNAKRLEDRMSIQSRSLRMASYVTTNSMVISRAVGQDGEALFGFGKSVRDMLDIAEKGLADLSLALNAANNVLGNTSEGIRNMKSVADELRQLRSTLLHIVPKLAKEAWLESSWASLHSSQVGIENCLSDLVSDLQCGDAARQRFEHVYHILVRSRDFRGSNREALQALAIAQFKKTVEELESSLASALPALDKIVEAHGAAEEETNQLLASPALLLLTDIGSVTNRMSRGLSLLDTLRQDLVPAMEQLAHSYGLAALEVKKISGLERQMQLVGYNATLISSRVGKDGQAMSEVSKQLREVTAEIGVHTAFILHQSQLQELKALIFTAPAAEAALSKIDRLASQLENVATSLSAAKDALEETKSFSGIKNRLHDIKQRATSVELKNTDPYIPEETSELNDCMVEIRKIYTMQSERVLHDSFLPQTEPSEAANFQEEDCDDDVFL